MTVALVAFDLDGTILESDGTIAPECAAEIIRLAGLGIRCVIASGRSVDFQAELVQRQGLPRYFDALICDERWVHLNAPPGVRSVQSMELQPLEPWNSDTGHRWAELGTTAYGWCESLKDWARSQGWSCEVNDHDNAVARGLRSVRGQTSEQAVAMMGWLEPQLDGSALACNANGDIVHIYDRSRDKGTALAALADHFDIAPERVLAFGDNINDQPMLDGRHRYRAATVANATAEVKRWVTETGGQIARQERGLGVAHLLRKLSPTPEMP